MYAKLYRINYILSFVMIGLIAHQAFAPMDFQKQFITENPAPAPVEATDDSKEKTD